MTLFVTVDGVLTGDYGSVACALQLAANSIVCNHAGLRTCGGTIVVDLHIADDRIVTDRRPTITVGANIAPNLAKKSNAKVPNSGALKIAADIDQAG